ncbi:helix-turn-helix domain-containing protein [Paenibacillus sanguinis]|uniref:helix-turn-helix domain-containing protein n=1 Tax=Paenibacillus sanguinis TaxID=225906 RepID=UPI000685EA00
MTKKAFCLELGISTGNLGDWKRGKSTPSTNKLIEIATFFDISLDWLMTGQEKQAEHIREGKVAYLVGEEDWNAFMNSLTESEWTFIREYIEFRRWRQERDNRKA